LAFTYFAIDLSVSESEIVATGAEEGDFRRRPKSNDRPGVGG
jgi:hypothetical protein